MRRLWGSAAAVGLISVAFLGGASSAQASCAYSTGPDGFYFGSVSPQTFSNGYSGNLTGSSGSSASQCWYDHGWSGGYFTVEGQYIPQAEDINVSDHGWVNICVFTYPQAPPGQPSLYGEFTWNFQTYDDSGNQASSSSSGQCPM